MAALNFPAAPSHLQTYTDPNQAVWQYDSDGTYWDVITSTTRKNFSGISRKLTASKAFNAVYEDIEWDTEDFQIDNYSRGSLTKVYAPTTGFYRVQLDLATDTNGEGASYSFQLRLNGTAIETVSVGPNQVTSYDETLELTEGDYLDVWGLETTQTGNITTDSQLLMYRIGFAPGTGISNHNAFSGVRAIRDGAFNTTSTPTAVTWNSTEFNANANVLGDLYWYQSVPGRVTVRATGYYKVRCFVQSGTAGSTDSYTVTLRKNGTTAVDSITMDANDTLDLDIILYLQEDDYLELMVSNSDNTGSVLDNTYLELVREGV